MALASVRRMTLPPDLVDERDAREIFDRVCWRERWGESGRALVDTGGRESELMVMLEGSWDSGFDFEELAARGGGGGSAVGKD